jgi:hypothetical protein
MLDLILSKCAEDNFMRVECTSEDMAREHGWKYKVCRISLNLSGGGAEDDGTEDDDSEDEIATICSSLSHACSLVRFGGSKYIPPILHFKYLRVVFFEITVDLCHQEIDLTAINQLFQLRYLKVSAEQYISLPTKMQGLVHLENGIR